MTNGGVSKRIDIRKMDAGSASVIFKTEQGVPVHAKSSIDETVKLLIPFCDIKKIRMWVDEFDNKFVESDKRESELFVSRKSQEMLKK